MLTKLLHSGFSPLHLLQLKETATQFATKIFLDIPKYSWTFQWKETDTHFATKIFLDPSRVFWKEGCLKNHYILLFVFFMYCGLYFSYLVVCIFSSPPLVTWLIYESVCYNSFETILWDLKYFAYREFLTNASENELTLQSLRIVTPQ